MSLDARSTSLLGTSSPPARIRSVPLTVLLGWILVAFAEVFGDPAGPDVPLVIAVTGTALLGPEAGFWSALLVGLLADLCQALPLGAQALAAVIAARLVASLATAIRQNAWSAPLVFTAVAYLPYRLLVRWFATLGGLEAAAGPGLGVRGLVWDLAVTLVVYLLVSRMMTGGRR